MARLLYSTAALALLSGAAVAADLPVYEPAPVVAPLPAFSWTGFYVGAQAGGKWGDTDIGFDDDDDGDGFLDEFDGGTADFDGWFIGGHVGYRYQWNWLVAGLEGDLEWVDVEGDLGFDDDDDGENALVLGSEMEWEGSIRATLGVGFDRVHVYGTGGFAFAGADSIFDDGDDDDLGVIRADGGDDTRTGWTAGAGVDVAVTDHITVGLLYKYVDLGDDDFNVFVGDDRVGNVSTDITYHSIQGRVAYKW
jgi:outer membrane immunogenic protein